MILFTKSSLILYFFFVTQIALSNVSYNFDSYLIIIGGGKTYTDAEVAKSRYVQHKELNQLIDTNVKIIKSDIVKGLNPGFYIAVLGSHTDRNYAELITNTANRYLNGIYMRKIEVKESSHYMIPVLLSNELPFEAQRFYCLAGINDYFLSDKTDDGNRLRKVIRSTAYYDEVYVDTSTVSFVKKLGVLDVKYYLAWLPEKRLILYVSQFQFSNIPKDLQVDFDGNIEWNCKGAGKRLVMSGEFKPYEFNETCVYSNGIETTKLRGYEYDNYQVKYPTDTYSFEDVMNYHLGKGHFRNLETINYQIGEFSHDGYEIKFLNNVLSIEGDDGHSWESIVIKEGFIIYEEGGGA